MNKQLDLFQAFEQKKIIFKEMEKPKRKTKPKKFIFSFVAKNKLTGNMFNGEIRADNYYQFLAIFRKFYKDTEIEKNGTAWNQRINNEV